MILSREVGRHVRLRRLLHQLGLRIDLSKATTSERRRSTRKPRCCAGSMGTRGGSQFALDNLGWAALLRGDHERAKACYEESLVLCRELGDKMIAVESLEGLACVAGA